MAFSFSTRS